MYSDYYSSGYRYGGGYSYSSNFDPAVFIGFVIFGAIAIAAIYVLTAVAMMKIFQKAGLPGWKAWVPVYNSWLFLELGGYNGGISILSVVTGFPGLGWIASIVFFVFMCMSANEISKKLQKPQAFILYPLGIISLGITTIIWYFRMGFGSTEWVDSLGKESLAKGTILGYEVQEEDEAQEAEIVEE
ncbi:MAG: hypothetical protein Q4A27_02855 [bacterium]|nr:hypothetical protein [bacterium]